MILLMVIFLSTNFLSQKILIPSLNNSTSKWEYKDTNEITVLELNHLELSKASLFTEGLAAVQDAKTKLWGYINEKGKWAIMPNYDVAEFFDGGFAIVRKKCQNSCYNGNEGLLSNSISYVIDKTGKVMCKDNSQDERPFARYFLYFNLGKGFFSIQRGIGSGERQDFINSKGQVLGETTFEYGPLALYYDHEIKAVKCGNKFFDDFGKIKLDLSKYQYVYNGFNEGYIWAYEEINPYTDDVKQMNHLLDMKGKIIHSFDIRYNNFSKVINGKFTFVDTDNNNAMMEMDLKTNKQYSVETLLTDIDDDVSQYGKIRPDGTIYVFSEDYSKIVGIVLKSGRLIVFDYD